MFNKPSPSNKRQSNSNIHSCWYDKWIWENCLFIYTINKKRSTHDFEHAKDR